MLFIAQFYAAQKDGHAYLKWYSSNKWHTRRESNSQPPDP